MSISTPSRGAPTARTAVAPLGVAAACWGVGTVVTKQVVDDVAPLTLLPVQKAASCTLLLAVHAARGEPVTWSPALRRLGALGMVNPGAAYALGLLGLTTITASLSVLLWALEPVVILLLAALLLRDHVPAGLAALVAVAITGVLLVVYQPGATGDAAGITLTLVSVGCCALYTVLTRRLMLDDSSLTVVVAQQGAALAFAVALATAVELAGGVGWEVGAGDVGVWAGAAVSGVLYYGLGFWFFLAGLRRVSASVAGSFLPLIPVFGVAAGHLVGERLAGRQWLGGRGGGDGRDRVATASRVAGRYPRTHRVSGACVSARLVQSRNSISRSAPGVMTSVRCPIGLRTRAPMSSRPAGGPSL